MNHLIGFYLKELRNSDGSWLEEIWAWSDEVWELEHDFIQHVFPLRTRSAFNPDAPLLDARTIREWHKDKLLQYNLHKSYERWLRFCGIGKINGKLHLVNRKANVWGGFNHNWLRITRVLRSLTLLGLQDDANEFFALLKDLMDSSAVAINDESFGFWKRAVGQ